MCPIARWVSAPKGTEQPATTALASGQDQQSGFHAARSARVEIGRNLRRVVAGAPPRQSRKLRQFMQMEHQMPKGQQRSNRDAQAQKAKLPRLRPSRFPPARDEIVRDAEET